MVPQNAIGMTSSKAALAFAAPGAFSGLGTTVPFSCRGYSTRGAHIPSFLISTWNPAGRQTGQKGRRMGAGALCASVRGSDGVGGRRWAIRMMIATCIATMSSPFIPMAALAKGGGAGEEAASGGVAGLAVHVVKQTLLYPIDTIKVRFQAEKADPTRPLWTRTDLFKGAYKGFLVPLVINSPASGVFFAVKDGVKSQLKPKIGNPLSTVAAIFVAQGPYWLIRQPGEAIKVKSQVAASEAGISRWEAIRKEVMGLDPRQPGAVQALFTGFWSNMAYAFPADATKFVCYDVLKQAVGGKPKDPLLAAALGAFSTSIAALATTPLDVGRNRIMTKNAKGEATGGDNILSVCNTILLEEGVRGLFLGLTPRIGRSVLSGAIQFATYETVKKI